MCRQSNPRGGVIGQDRAAVEEKNATILLVEDSAIVAQHESLILRERGFSVTPVRSGEEAVATVSRTPDVDLVLLDIELGAGMDGVATAREIQRFSDVPIVFLTSHGEESYIRRTAGLKHYGYLLKEGSEFNLVQAVESALRVHDDISERRLLLERAEELAGIGSWQWNIEKDEWTVSANFFRIHGIQPRRLRTDELMPLAHPDDRPKLYRALEQVKHEGRRYDMEHRIIRADTFETRIVHSIGEVEYFRGTSKPATLYGSVQDITERKEAERLAVELQEKDRILGELNHRIKNNLSLVASLVAMKDHDLGDAADLSDIRSQIRAISSLHDRIYAGDRLTHVELRPYLTDLLETMFEFYRHGAVALSIRVGDATVPSKTATTLGLIVNELATNAMKHGFHPNTPAAFAVELRNDQAGSTHTLTVSNTGNPFPEDVDIAGESSHGLGLVLGLVHGMDGTLELNRRPSPSFTIRWRDA